MQCSLCLDQSTDTKICSKISFWEYSFIINKHNQKPTRMSNNYDVTAYLTYIKILKD